jgi:hypothetical protein
VQQGGDLRGFGNFLFLYGLSRRGRTKEHAMQQKARTGLADADNPLHHTRKMSAEFSALIDHLRHDIELVEEPQFKAMFETAAEVLGGLVNAFDHYEQKSEAAWAEAARKSK